MHLFETTAISADESAAMFIWDNEGGESGIRFFHVLRSAGYDSEIAKQEALTALSAGALDDCEAYVNGLVVKKGRETGRPTI